MNRRSKTLSRFLNTSSTSTRDKEVVIRESYLKVFRDNTVQIEDDLESREVVTNKNVVAYLKDVDFFFTDVRFEFNVETIQSGSREGNKQFYKVALQRNMKGTTLDGEQVNSTVPRFIEVNYDPDTDGLAIASIYTRGFDEAAALTGWWNDLSYEWKNIFRKKLKLSADSLPVSDIKRVAAIDSLDLSNNLYIKTLEPLAQLAHLQHLNLSATTIGDLTAIRNLTELTDLSVAGTAVDDLSPLKYAASMKRLNASNTAITSVEALQKMPSLQSLALNDSKVSDVSHLAALTGLQHLSIAGAPVTDIEAVGKLSRLTILDISRTLVSDISALSAARELTMLNIDSTKVRDLRPLAGAVALKEVTANYSRIDNLEPLKTLPSLERIYCDQTQIVRSIADEFMASRPNVLVIYDSRDLKAWWEALTPDWQKAVFAGETPSKDDLARITNLDSINLSRFTSLSSLEPLKRVPKLRVLIASGTGITDLAPVKDLKEITVLDISNTEVSDLAPLRLWKKLSILKANNTKIQNIDPLTSMESLKRLYLDDTGIHDLHAREYLARRPEVLLVYKTYHVQRWWTRLSGDWKKVFQSMVSTADPGIEELHRLVERKSLSVSDVSVSELGSLSEFVQLEELHFAGTSVTDLSPLTTHVGLKSLHATNGPLRNLGPIAGMMSLEDLDVSGTPIDDLRAIATLLNLKRINFSGTEVRKLDPLSRMSKLEFLDCSNTSVGQLDPLAHLPLKTVKCFNTRISKREVEKWKLRGVEVVFY
jgi:Leucine-rich repeat (LRR) protein